MNWQNAKLNFAKILTSFVLIAFGVSSLALAQGSIRGERIDFSQAELGDIFSSQVTDSQEISRLNGLSPEQVDAEGKVRDVAGQYFDNTWTVKDENGKLRDVRINTRYLARNQVYLDTNNSKLRIMEGSEPSSSDRFVGSLSLDSMIKSYRVLSAEEIEWLRRQGLNVQTGGPSGDGFIVWELIRRGRSLDDGQIDDLLELRILELERIRRQEEEARRRAEERERRRREAEEARLQYEEYLESLNENQRRAIEDYYRSGTRGTPGSGDRLSFEEWYSVYGPEYPGRSPEDLRGQWEEYYYGGGSDPARLDEIARMEEELRRLRSQAGLPDIYESSQYGSRGPSGLSYEEWIGIYGDDLGDLDDDARRRAYEEWLSSRGRGPGYDFSGGYFGDGNRADQIALLEARLESLRRGGEAPRDGDLTAFAELIGGDGGGIISGEGYFYRGGGDRDRQIALLEERLRILREGGGDGFSGSEYYRSGGLNPGGGAYLGGSSSYAYRYRGPFLEIDPDKIKNKSAIEKDKKGEVFKLGDSESKLALVKVVYDDYAIDWPFDKHKWVLARTYKDGDETVYRMLSPGEHAFYGDVLESIVDQYEWAKENDVELSDEEKDFGEMAEKFLKCLHKKHGEDYDSEAYEKVYENALVNKPSESSYGSLFSGRSSYYEGSRSFDGAPFSADQQGLVNELYLIYQNKVDEGSAEDDAAAFEAWLLALREGENDPDVPAALLERWRLWAELENEQSRSSTNTDSDTDTSTETTVSSSKYRIKNFGSTNKPNFKIAEETYKSGILVDVSEWQSIDPSLIELREDGTYVLIDQETPLADQLANPVTEGPETDQNLEVTTEELDTNGDGEISEEELTGFAEKIIVIFRNGDGEAIRQAVMHLPEGVLTLEQVRETLLGGGIELREGEAENRRDLESQSEG